MLVAYVRRSNAASGTGDKSYLAGAFRAALDGGTADLIGPIDAPHEFVFVPDVGPVVVRLLGEPSASGRTWHLAGAGTTTQQAMVEEISRQAGCRVRTRVAGRTMLRLLGLFKPMLREMAEMHYLLTEPVFLDDSALERLIGPVGHRMPTASGARWRRFAPGKPCRRSCSLSREPRFLTKRYMLFIIGPITRLFKFLRSYKEATS